MVKCKKYILRKPYVGLPKRSDLELVEEELPPLKDGEFLVPAVFISIDPFIRAFVAYNIEQDVIAFQIAVVTETKHPDFPVGQHVLGYFGCRTKTISNGINNFKLRNVPVTKVPTFENYPISYNLGCLGFAGNSAYFGLLDLCQPKEGEILVVTAAGGSVGSIAGQIGKIKGCFVIGIAGSEEKGKWITEELGFDSFINYKTQNVEEELKKLAPEGIDIYFDNVAGEIATKIIKQMKYKGRVCCCGMMSIINDIEPSKGEYLQPILVIKDIKMEGFLVSSFYDRWSESSKQNLEWMKEGKLKYRETVTEGFENFL